MDSEFQTLIRIERNLLCEVAFDVLGIPRDEFYQFGSSALRLSLLEQEKIAPDHEIAVDAKKEFDLLCGSAPSISPDAIKAICLASCAHEVCFGGNGKEDMTAAHAASVLSAIAMTRGFAMGAASASPAASDAMRKELLSMAGLRGATVKHSKSRSLKTWAEQQARIMKGADLDIARRLAAQIPEHLADASKNPERLIYEHLRDRRNTAS